ncbi:MAG: superoxide dismutase [Candidatus Hodarchaeota archaeon]
MKIIALEREIPGIEAEAFTPHLQTEVRKIWELYQAGIIRELYFRADRQEAVLILECEDIPTARKHLSKLPFVKAGLIIFDLIPLKAYPGFSRLFHPENTK